MNSSNWPKIFRSPRAALATAILAMSCAVLPANAQTAGSGASEAKPASDASATSPKPPISVELNKLETLDTGCRAYVVVTNTTDDPYETLKLDLVMFKPDGVIGRRFAVDLAPLRKDKRSVKLFDLAGVGCTDVGNLLINDVLECRTDAGPVEDCLSRLAVTSLTKASLSK